MLNLQKVSLVLEMVLWDNVLILKNIILDTTFQGSYIAGVYYPDKTRVGWWKNGYPEYFAKVLNAPNWIGIRH